MHGRARDRARHRHGVISAGVISAGVKRDRSRPGPLDSGRDQRGQARRHGIRQAWRVPPERPDPHERNHLARIRRLPRRDRAGAAEHFPKTLCNGGFGPTGVCVLAKSVNPKTGAVFVPVRNDRVTGLLVTGFPGNGVFGYGTVGLSVTRVVAINDGGYGISRFVSSRTVFANDTAIGNEEAGFYVGDSPKADTVVRNDQAFGNQFGIFIRHARHVLVTGNVVSGNCQGILVLDDGQRGGAGHATIAFNRVFDNNKFCKKNGDTPVDTKGGGILLLGATHTLVTHNSVTGNAGKKFNSGGIVVLSAKPLSHGSNPEFDTISFNFAFHDHPADLIWDHTGFRVRFRHNACGTSNPWRVLLGT